MKRPALLCIGLLLLVASLVALTEIRSTRPPAERLGYMPSFEVAYFSSLEYRLLISELMFFNAVFYYGTLTDKPEEKPDYLRIYQYVATSTRLNPYNIDSYYFGQAILTWDAGMVRGMNSLLEMGVVKRNWDFYLPFFLGFNYSYFLNEFEKAAQYTAMAAQLNPHAYFLTTLAGRLYYQANKTDLALQYLTTVYNGTKNEAVKKALLIRIETLERVALLEKTVKLYESKTGYPPRELSDLVREGILTRIPEDPYGGAFYLDRHDGRVKTTSNMADTRSKQ